MASDKQPTREELASYGYALPAQMFEGTHPADEGAVMASDDRPVVHDERAFDSPEAQFTAKPKAEATGAASVLPGGAGGKVPASTVAQIGKLEAGNILETGDRNAVPDAAAAGEGGPVAAPETVAPAVLPVATPAAKVPTRRTR